MTSRDDLGKSKNENKESLLSFLKEAFADRVTLSLATMMVVVGVIALLWV